MESYALRSTGRRDRFSPMKSETPRSTAHNRQLRIISDQADRVKVMVLHDEFVAPGDILRTGQQFEMPVLQNALFVGGKVMALSFAHGGSLKKFPELVPNKMLTP